MKPVPHESSYLTIQTKNLKTRTPTLMMPERLDDRCVFTAHATLLSTGKEAEVTCLRKAGSKTVIKT